MTNDTDPGWRPALQSMVPFAGLVRLRRGRETNGLIIMRTIFLGLVLSLFLFPVALSYIGPWDGGDEGWVPFAVLLNGIASVAWVLGIRRRQLLATSAEELAGSYRTLMFTGIAAADAALFGGIAGVLFGGSLWIYLAGMPFALVGLWLIAPSRGDIERRQREITATGSSLSLVDALVSAPRSTP